MVNMDLLRAVVNKAEGNRDFTKNLGRLLDRTPSNISHKNNGWNGTCYSQDELNIIRKHYGIDNETFCEIFFAD